VLPLKLRYVLTLAMRVSLRVESVAA